MLKNLNTATKIMILISVTAIFLGIVGYAGYHFSAKISILMDDMYKNNLLSVKSLNAARTHARSIEADMLLLLHPLTNKQQETAISKEIGESTELINELLGNYEKSRLDTFEKENYAVARESLNRVRQVRSRTLELLAAGNKEAAFLYYDQNSLNPLNDLNSSLKNLADHIAEVSAKENKEGIADAVLAGRIILWATLAAILLALGIGFVIARMIAVPLGVMLKDVELVAAGDLSVKRIEMNRRDEVGKLAKAFNQMVDNLHTLVKHVSQASEQVAASSEELTASADQMAKASTQVADSISGVAQGADRQLQSVTDAMAVVEELSAGAEQIAASSSNVAAMSEKTACAARDGEKAVDVAINKMADIEKTVLNSADMVTGLGNRSKEIGQIVGVISGLASQTNLLALNAAIEAARAGEQGRGFAVVAEEVRKLAEQSQEAAKHIASLISAIQSDTDKAVTAMNDGTREVKNGAEVVNVAGRAFKEIVASIGEMSQQIREISDAVQQMAQGSEQIVESVRNIDDISKTTAGATQSVSAATEENSATMQEIAASSETLSALAQQLQALVCKFQV